MLRGLRGSHLGSFESAHNLRDGDFWKNQREITDTGERYDLIVVGGGISGLSAAHFYRGGRPDAKILILDNHDDFGRHAKRNEFHLSETGSRMRLMSIARTRSRHRLPSAPRMPSRPILRAVATAAATSSKYPRLCTWAQENIEETLTYYRLPLSHHKHMKATNIRSG
jgi:hypothetical protein